MQVLQAMCSIVSKAIEMKYSGEMITDSFSTFNITQEAHYCLVVV